jgi:membrane protease YdiL (CAAX protease family)
VSLALAGPPLVTLACRCLGGGIEALIGGDLLLVAIALTVVAIARGQRFDRRSLGLRRPDWTTLAGGLLLAALSMWVTAPLASWLMRLAGSAGFAPRLDRLLALPRWARAVAVVVGCPVEEWLYRGYATAALSRWTRSAAWGASLATAAFALAHLPAWGLAVSLSLLIPGSVATLVYVWRQDLALAALAHVITDAAGILLSQ